VAGLVGPCLLGGQEPSVQSGDQIMDRATLPLGGPDHPANPPRLSLLTASLVSLQGRAVVSQIGIELLTLCQQHFPEMLSLKAIRGFGRLVSQIHIAR
jgi:hypothetical protein